MYNFYVLISNSIFHNKDHAKDRLAISLDQHLHQLKCMSMQYKMLIMRFNPIYSIR
ncbi:hypothetical protein SPHINGO8BC_50210 [Sphingobacterium multivorum]|uniref:Uncharacterized protein n=1 Tax=Sphingobacterium multivorum TaxID=28454 RepID=A0A654BLL7_SPHMU|nr:hypothetical protein SPHINGO8BC_50210 [Sphingobacterium multivorum]